MQQLHVVFFPAWYPHRGDPMPGLFIKHHAQALLPHAKVSVVQVIGETRHSGSLLEFDFSEEEGISTLRVYYRKLPGAIGKLLDGFNYLYGTAKGYSMLVARCGKVDLHHVHVLTRAGFFPWLMRVSGGVPYLISEHWSRYLPQNRHKFTGKLRHWLTRQVVKKAHAVCPVNENLALAMQAMGFANARYRVLNNVVDTDRFIIKENTEVFHKLLHVSCFDEPAKNVKGLLRALAVARKTNPALFLSLVGDGPDHEEVKNYALELGLAASTEFVGLQTGNELVAQYHNHGCFVLFSNYENQPVVILEALACGKPVIATNVGSIAGLLDENRGIVIAPGDEVALAKAMTLISTSPPDGLAESRRHYIASHFSYNAIGEQLVSLYKEALE